MVAPRAKQNASTLIELFVVVMCLVVLIGVLLITTKRNRRGSSRLVCLSNLKGIGTSCKIYANDNFGQWPMPPFDETMIGRIDYTLIGGGDGTIRSPSRTQPSVSGAGGATKLSVTRSFWMLVRSGDVTVRQFVCPRTGDTPDPAARIDDLYDFAGYGHISYGFQVPFGPMGTRATEARDNRLALAADKGPYVDAAAKPPVADPTLIGSDPARFTVTDLKLWRPFNSPNHGGEGQNVLYADGHASFVRTPTVGVDHDNIYTVALDNSTYAGVVIGESPRKRFAHPFAATPDASSTDSVIFP